MGELVFIIGGARSGKSRYAVELAKKRGKKTVFLATSIAKDEEMKKRIKLHKESRPLSWATIEEGKNPLNVLINLKKDYKVVILDCLTFLISNLLLDGVGEELILKEIRGLAKVTLKNDYKLIVVSNEVGEGVVPHTQLGRDFRDIAGKSNQIMADYAQEVYLMVAGIPLKLKGEKCEEDTKNN